MGHPDTVELKIRVRDLDRSRAVYRRLGLVELAAGRADVCRFRCGDVVLVLTHRGSRGADADRGGPAGTGLRGGGPLLTVVVRDLDEILAYWLEEGMLVVSGPEGTVTGRAFHGLDHDGNEIRIEAAPTASA